MRFLLYWFFVVNVGVLRLFCLLLRFLWLSRSLGWEERFLSKFIIFKYLVKYSISGFLLVPSLSDILRICYFRDRSH